MIDQAWPGSIWEMTALSAGVYLAFLILGTLQTCTLPDVLNPRYAGVHRLPKAYKSAHAV